MRFVRFGLLNHSSSQVESIDMHVYETLNVPSEPTSIGCTNTHSFQMTCPGECHDTCMQVLLPLGCQIPLHIWTKRQRVLNPRPRAKDATWSTFSFVFGSSSFANPSQSQSAA